MQQRTIYMGERVPASIILDDGKLEVRRVNVELLSLNDSDSDCEEEMVPVNGTRKRRRLTNLSPEEKMLRRKLKNRMAAQTARDRKKQKMADLEEMLAVMQEENKKLQAENLKLKSSTSSLTKENEQLRERLHSPIVVVKEETGVKSQNAVSTETLLERCYESAELSPQQQDTTLITFTLLTVLCCVWRASVAISMLPYMMTIMKAVSSSSVDQSLVKREPLDPQEPPPPDLAPLPQWWGSHQKSWNPSKN